MNDFVFVVDTFSHTGIVPRPFSERPAPVELAHEVEAPTPVAELLELPHKANGDACVWAFMEQGYEPTQKLLDIIYNPTHSGRGKHGFNIKKNTLSYVVKLSGDTIIRESNHTAIQRCADYMNRSINCLNRLNLPHENTPPTGKQIKKILATMVAKGYLVKLVKRTAPTKPPEVKQRIYGQNKYPGIYTKPNGQVCIYVMDPVDKSSKIIYHPVEGENTEDYAVNVRAYAVEELRRSGIMAKESKYGDSRLATQADRDKVDTRILKLLGVTDTR